MKVSEALRGRRISYVWDSNGHYALIPKDDFSALCDLVEAVEEWDALQAEMEETRPDWPIGLLERLRKAHIRTSATLQSLRKQEE